MNAEHAILVFSVVVVVVALMYTIIVKRVRAECIHVMAATSGYQKYIGTCVWVVITIKQCITWHIGRAETHVTNSKSTTTLISISDAFVRNEWLDWVNISTMPPGDDKILQCEKCDPSTDEFVYQFNKYWSLTSIQKKCVTCDNRVIFKYSKHDFSNTHIIDKFSRCSSCDPSTNYIKYKWHRVCCRWVPNTFKAYNTKAKRHVWKKVDGVSIDAYYKCSCDKCN